MFTLRLHRLGLLSTSGWRLGSALRLLPRRRRRHGWHGGWHHLLTRGQTDGLWLWRVNEFPAQKDNSNYGDDDNRNRHRFWNLLFHPPPPLHGRGEEGKRIVPTSPLGQVQMLNS